MITHKIEKVLGGLLVITAMRRAVKTYKSNASDSDKKGEYLFAAFAVSIGMYPFIFSK
jgi:hypothetical protein